MTSIEPVIRHMLLCDDVRVDPTTPHKIDIIGLVSVVQSTQEFAFPLRHPEFCVFVQTAGGRGLGRIAIQLERADTEEIIFAGSRHSVVFGEDPLSVKAFSFRIQDCVFPESGLYYVQLVYNEKVLANHPLLVR